jgi:AraC family transcriptional regulator
VRSDRDLIVAVDVSRALTLDGKVDDLRGPRPSYWQNVVPQQVPEAEFGEHLIVVHTADHAGRVPGSFCGLRVDAKGRAKNVGPAPTHGNAFCGWDKPVSMIRLELPPEYLRRVDAAFGSVPSQPQVVNVLHARDPKILQMGAWLLDELHDGSAGSQVYADSLANVLALHLLRRYGATAAMPGYPETSQLPQGASAEVLSAVEYMQAYLGHPISLADLSQAAHVSPSHLARLFKRSTGLTPHQFLIRLRVDHAKKLLLSTRLAISEVAAQSGFADQSHLNRHLKRVYGVTPNAILNKR